MTVWGYWKCPYCKGIVQGKSRTCPNCGSAIPNNVKYLPPDHYEVKQAISNGTILIPKDEQFVDEKGIVSEVVKQDEVRDNPNWVCEFCGYQNFNEEDYCEGCGAPRNSKTYFDTPSEEEQKKEKHSHMYGKFEASPMVPFNKDDEYEHFEKYEEYIDDEDDEADEEDNNSSSVYVSHLHKDSEPYREEVKTKRSLSINPMPILKGLGIVLGILFLVWLFWPVTRKATVESFRWTRSIHVEEFKKVRESDWYLPSGAKLAYTQEEVHHYDHVLDHYETKTRTVYEQVFDGYETSYRDKGNGQFEVVQTPKYKTVSKTETYQEPVYKDVPVYQTKYYYDIGRWRTVDELRTAGAGQEPYWAETNLPSTVASPSFGDRKQGSREQSYYVKLKPEDDEAYETTFDYDKWKSMKVGDNIEYKSFRFSKKPIG